jgi:hypothetical protein
MAEFAPIGAVPGTDRGAQEGIHAGGRSHRGGGRQARNSLPALTPTRDSAHHLLHRLQSRRQAFRHPDAFMAAFASLRIVPVTSATTV